MRVIRCSLWILIFALLATHATLPAQDKKPTPNDFFGVWIEEKRESGGKVYDQPGELFGWDLTADEAGCWERRGEAVYSKLGKVRVRVDKDPVWFDIIGSTTKVKVGDKLVEQVSLRPGIVKRDGKNLIWVWAKDYYVADPKDIAEWNARPKSFEINKDDPWEKMTLYPSKGRYTTD